MWRGLCTLVPVSPAPWLPVSTEGDSHPHLQALLDGLCLHFACSARTLSVQAWLIQV